MKDVRFWVYSSRYMLVEIITNTKTQFLCLSEFLQKWFFQVSYWSQACFYGQVTMALMPTHKSHQETRLLFASQEAQIGRTAPGRKRLNNTKISQNSSHTYSSTFINSRAIEDFKIRLFNGLYTFWQNKRLRWGLITLLILAPLSKFFYLLLPEFGFGEYLIEIGSFKVVNNIEVIYVGDTVEGDWFYNTFYWYFFSLGELLAPLVSIFGIFLLFPKQYYPSYLVGVPFGYFLSLLIHRMFVTTYDQYHEGFGTAVIATWIILGVIVFIISDKLLFKQNHVKRASEARMVGLINMPGMDWEDKEKLLKKEAKEWSQTENELYTKTG